MKILRFSTLQLQSSRLLKEGVILVLIQLLVGSPQPAAAKSKAKINAAKSLSSTESFPSKHQILQNSQISYRATGGFTGVEFFGVIASCVEGQISILKTLHNPKGLTEKVIRQTERLSQGEYLDLWHNLERQRVFQIKNASQPKEDILDEFTFDFDIRVGTRAHSFKIFGISRPEGSRYFAVKSLIDAKARMTSLWTQHSQLAQK